MLDKVTPQFWIKGYHHMIPKLLQASRSDFFGRLPISTSALTSLNTAPSPFAEALDFGAELAEAIEAGEDYTKECWTVEEMMEIKARKKCFCKEETIRSQNCISNWGNLA